MKFNLFIPDFLHLDGLSTLWLLIQTLSPLEEAHDGVLGLALSAKSTMPGPKPRL